MRSTVVVLCILTAGCSGQSLKSPVSPSSVAGTAVLGQDGADVSQTSAQQGTDLPFRGTFTGQSRATFEPPDVLVITATVTGTATHLGRFEAHAGGRGPEDGTFNFTAANGDQLFTTTVAVPVEFIPPNVSKVEIDATIVGGTGRFQRASGTLRIHLTDVIDFASSTGSWSGSIEGHISWR
jgi:hypothetical protein